MNGIGKWLVFAVMISMFLPLKVGAVEKVNREKMLQEFKAADLNKDGYVSESEYKRYIEKKFESEETAPKKESSKRQGEEFVVTGKEKEERIKFKTFLNGRLRFFNEADANKDRLLSLQEYTRMMMIDPVR